MTDLLVTGARIIDPDRSLDAVGHVLVRDGLIVSAGPERPAAGPDPIEIDGEGLIAAPGLIDLHVHFREPSTSHEETIATGSAAAVAGGFTTVCCMPNTTPPLDEPERLDLVRARAEEAGLVRLWPVACATVGRAGKDPVDFRALAEAGAIAFSDDGDCVADADVMLAVLHGAAAVDRPFMQHCQEPTLTRGASMNAGPVAERAGQVGWPAVAEELIIERDVRLNRAAGCRYHAQHVSSGASVEIIARARALGEPVTGEASPHHLLLTDEACRDLDPMTKMNPPLRTAADVERLRQGVARGEITVLATDHAPHPAATKARPFGEASFGIVGLECAVPLYARALVETGLIDWPRLIALMTLEPARLLGLDRRGFGRLMPRGGPADMTLIDPEHAWTIDVGSFRSAGRNCPFDGWSVQGKAMITLVGGAVKYADPAVLPRLTDRAVGLIGAT